MTKKERQEKFFSIHDRKEYYHNQYLKRKDKFLENYKNGIHRRCSLETQRKNHKKQVDNLTDYYCKVRLIDNGFSKEDITPELIELKRQQLILKRNIKQIEENTKL